MHTSTIVSLVGVLATIVCACAAPTTPDETVGSSEAAIFGGRCGTQFYEPVLGGTCRFKTLGFQSDDREDWRFHGALSRDETTISCTAQVPADSQSWCLSQFTGFEADDGAKVCGTASVFNNCPSNVRLSLSGRSFDFSVPVPPGFGAFTTPPTDDELDGLLALECSTHFDWQRTCESLPGFLSLRTGATYRESTISASCCVPKTSIPQPMPPTVESAPTPAR